jgi:polar amino acid transport system substrate-binding protein
VVIAGVTAKSPYKKEASLTRPYVKTELVVGVLPGSDPPDDLDGVEVVVEAGDEAGGLVERKTDADVTRVQTIGDVRGRAAALEEFFLEDLGLEQHGDRLKLDKHVIALRLGENAFLVELERYLLNNEDRIEDLLREEQP